MKRTIAIALSIFVTLALAVYGMLYLEDYRWNKEHVQPTVAASDSGVYLLHPNHRPKRLLRWHREHYILLFSEDVWYALDEDTLYRIDPTDWVPVECYTGIDLDWSLGAAAFAVSEDEVFYLPPEEPQWGTLPGLEGVELSLRTMVHLTPQGRIHLRIPATTDSQPVIKNSYKHLYSVARDREGRIALVVNSDLSSRLKSEWVDPQGYAVLLNAYNDLRLVGVQPDGVLRTRKLVPRTGEFQIQSDAQYRELHVPAEGSVVLHSGEGTAMVLYRDRIGSLRLYSEQSEVSELVYFMAFFSDAALHTASWQNGCLTISDGETTWAYVKTNAKWKCWRLP